MYIVKTTKFYEILWDFMILGNFSLLELILGI